jgi:hypothetical protein
VDAVLRRAPLAALAVLAIAGAAARASVYGSDDRHAVGSRTAHRHGYVGLLHAPSGRAVAGTATLVGPDRILTAAHVLFDERGELRRPLGALRFRLGADFARAPHSEREIARIVATGHREVYDPDRQHLDWAVLELVPLATARTLAPPIEPADLLEAEAGSELWLESQRVELVAYHRDVGGGGVRVATRCRTLVRDDEPARSVLALPGVLAHDCDATGMSSGAGLFVRRAGRLELAAIHVGKLGPERARRADLAREHFNVAIALDASIRSAIDRP